MFRPITSRSTRAVAGARNGPDQAVKLAFGSASETDELQHLGLAECDKAHFARGEVLVVHQPSWT